MFINFFVVPLAIIAACKPGSDRRRALQGSSRLRAESASSSATCYSLDGCTSQSPVSAVKLVRQAQEIVKGLCSAALASEEGLLVEGLRTEEAVPWLLLSRCQSRCCIQVHAILGTSYGECNSELWRYPATQHYGCDTDLVVRKVHVGDPVLTICQDVDDGHGAPLDAVNGCGGISKIPHCRHHRRRTELAAVNIIHP